MKADLTLVEEAKAGNQAAFSELVRRHQKTLLRLCLRFTRDLQTAEEVVQESFVKAYEKLNSFEGRSSFKSWLFQIGVNNAKNWLRGQKGDAISLDDVQMSVAAQAETGMIKQDLKTQMQKEIDKLPERQKTAVVLRIYEDLSFAEIAQIMECPYDTAKANFRHGLLKLKASFEESSSFTAWTDEEEVATMNAPNEVES
jgi:RNA polymerase sigma-70 factor (ECF subfamily)